MQRSGQLDKLLISEAEALAQPMWDFDSRQVKLAIATMQHDPDIAGAVAVSDSGDLLASIGQISESPSNITGSRDVTFTEDGAPMVIGELTVALSKRPLLASLKGRALLEGALLAVLLLAVVLTAVVANRSTIGIPLRRLLNSIQATESGGRRSRVDWPSRDEMGEVVSAFNQMQERQEIYETELHDARDNLEQRVAERTAALEHAREDADKARIAAEQGNQAKSAFVANMSHEVRTPLNAIIGLTGLALETNVSPQQRDYLIKVADASESLLTIVNDILDFSKIEAGKLGIEVVDFSLDELLDRVATITAVKASEKYLELLFSVEPGVPDALRGDPLRLEQVLLNLITNAIKFTEAGDVVLTTSAVSTEGAVTAIEYSVRDTGIGISDADQKRVFAAFAQADDSMTRKFGGTGLGLAIARELVQLMDGSLDVESAPGKGTTVSFQIPFQPAQDATSAPLAAQELSGLHVLLADDNSSAREVFAAQLGGLGCQVTAVPSGADAVAEFEHAAGTDSPYRLLVMDWKMPEMDGLQAVAAIKQIAAEHRQLTTVIMVTAFDHQALLSDPSAELADTVLTKPVSLSSMRDAILTALGVQAISSRSGSRFRGQGKTAALPNFSGASVLLVEDNPINRQIAREILQSAGVLVEEAKNGREALERTDARADEPPYSAILMDIQMPEMDGYEATRRLRQRWDAQALPIIAFTAHALDEERRRCRAAGMNTHIPKPIIKSVLFNALGAYLRPDAEARTLPPMTAPSMGESTAGACPDLPGIAVASALRRLDMDAETYLELLQDFAEEYRGSPAAIETQIAQGEFAQAREVAHTIKGLAASLGAEEVGSLAADIEAELKQENTPDDAQVAALASAMQVVVAGLDSTA